MQYRTLINAVHTPTLKKNTQDRNIKRKKIDHPGGTGPSQSRNRSTPTEGESF